MPAHFLVTSGTWGRCHIPSAYRKLSSRREKRVHRSRTLRPALAAFTTMVHTISGIVFHRFWRMCAANDTPREARDVIGEMVAQVRQLDAQFFDRFVTGPLEELPGMARLRPPRNPIRTVKPLSASSTHVSMVVRLASWIIERLAHYGRGLPYRGGTTGSSSQRRGGHRSALNPARNLYRRETLNVGVHAPIMRAMQHASFTFAKKISHTADSQDQRHRMVPGSRRCLLWPIREIPITSRPCCWPAIPGLGGLPSGYARCMGRQK